MGTYTTNYNLFMPSVGEQGWGDLVNGNFTTIDVTMKGLGNNIGTLETEIDAIEERVTTLEAGNFDATVSAEKFNGALCVNVSSTLTNEIGTYTVVTNTNTVSSPTYSMTTNGATLGSLTISVTDVLVNMKRGFVPYTMPSLNMTVNVSTTQSKAWGLIIEIYRNNTLIDTRELVQSNNHNYSVSLLVSKGDDIIAKIKSRPQSNTSLSQTANVTFSKGTSTGNLYLA